MNLKKTLLTCVVVSSILFVDLAYCQSAGQITIPQLIPPAPNAAALAQYSDIAVSKYSGVPNISIPIYTIDTDGFQLPISLSYHASGIKVAQEASSAGLGWVLNAGGVITRQIRGIEDFANNPGVEVGFLYSTDLPEYMNYEGLYNGPGGSEDGMGATILDPFINFSTPYPQLSRDGITYPQNVGGVGSIHAHYIADTESDLYSFNFGGFSGKFVINKDGSTVNYTPENGLKIELINGSSWQVTSNIGVRYIFSEKEYTRPFTFVANSYYESLLKAWGGTGSAQYASSWYLSQIILPNSNTIDFQYNQLNTESWYFGPITVNKAMPIPGRGTCVINEVYNSYNNRYLKSSSQNIMVSYLETISWNNGSINLSYLGREDLFYEIMKPLKLDKISVNSGNNEVSFIKFNTSYFNSQYSNQNDKYFALRLKLDGLTINDKIYEFTYENPNSLPLKHSLSYDHWGYYNAEKNRGSEFYWDQASQSRVYTPYFLPELMVMSHSIFSEDILFEGANRQAKASVIKNGILTSGLANKIRIKS